jgi:cation:H+ antiporter
MELAWGRTVVIEIVIVVAGLVLLTVSADHLVLGSARIATRLRISPVVVGVVVIGLGTSAPEFLVSGVAASRGDVGIAIGNIVGSNILNVTLVLGLAALVAPVAVASTVIRREVRLSIASVALFAAVAWTGLSVRTGAILITAGMMAMGLLLYWAKWDPAKDLPNTATDFVKAPAVLDAPMTPSRVPAAVEPIRAVLGLAGVLIGAELIVDNASTLAVRFGVSQVVIGLTVVALGTSLPELVTTVAAQRRNDTDLVVGNLFGSNLFNSLAGGAVIAFAGPGNSSARPAAGLLGLMVLTAVLAWALLRRGLRLTRPEGGVLLGLYLVSTAALISG